MAATPGWLNAADRILLSLDPHMLRRKFWLIVSALLLAVYAGYVIWAKLATTIGAPPVRLSETSEFLLFLAAVIAFSLQVFVEDARRDGDALHLGTDA